MNSNLFKNLVLPFTMTSVERIQYLYDSLEYIRTNDTQGDIVECGVWKGGNIFGIMEYLSYHKMTKKIWMYDTFEGMTKTTEFDVDCKGNSGSFWENKCQCSLSEVKKLLSESSYDQNLINYVEGDICKTLNFEKNIPKKISLLRLDTDWYESTKKELEVLYPKLIIGGVLIVDDFGHWEGSKKAVVEYFENNFSFDRIDYTGIGLIKK